MNGDILELLFVAAFILFGLLGGRKKRPRPQQPLPRREPRAAADHTAVRRPVPSAGPARGPGMGQDRLLRELESLLTGRPVPPEPGSKPSLPDPDEARSLETLEPEAPSRWEEARQRTAEVGAGWRAGAARAAESLETLEEAGEASHRRFHALYDRSADPAPPVERKPVFPSEDMRRAIIWSEILGPPVSER